MPSRVWRITALTLVCCESSCILVLEDELKVTYSTFPVGDPAPYQLVLR